MPAVVERVHAHLVRVNHPGRFRLPHKCVVCGSDEIEWVEYVQFDAPLITPWFSAISDGTSAHFPYCSQHSQWFKFRLFALRASQVMAAGGAISLLVYLAYFAGKFHDDDIWILPATLIPALLWLLASVYLIRPRLYDVTLSFSDHCVYLRTKFSKFADRIMEVNR